ncbi:hypothetical protein DPMN_168912 [Dreissena polymorpha]|uniref:Uncharacterized protein n=1 Tax=Dreissena polymorpha TaxID=45954 RepID=A0A9D4F1M2_DREPO|nr:hypothetical protein DPMN_168912 [Dreissena polymorpha]
MEPIGDYQDRPYSRACLETILEKNHDDESGSTDSGLTAIKADDNDVLLLDKLLSSIDDVMKNPHEIVEPTEPHEESDKATARKSKSALSSIMRALRLSKKQKAIQPYFCVPNTQQQMSNRFIQFDVQLVWHFDLKQRNDATVFRTNGCVWVGEFIAVAISESNLVNLIDVNKKSVVSTFFCDSQPLSITAIADGAYLMVCLPDSCRIDVLTIFNRCITCVLEIDCEVPIYDVVHLYGCEFYGLDPKTGTLLKIKLRGLKLSRVFSSERIDRVLRASNKLTFNKRLAILYVSRSAKNEVVGITANGEDAFTYFHKDLQYPFQAAVHNSGYVFLTSARSNVLHVVTEYLEHRTTLLSGQLLGPRAICFNDTQDKLAVVDSTPGKELRIYNLQIKANLNMWRCLSTKTTH